MPGRATGALSATTRPPGPLATSPLSSSPSPTSTQNQHEVLQNFFNRLLSSSTRDRGAAGAIPGAGVERPPSSQSQAAPHEGVNGNSSDVNGATSGTE